MRRALTLGAGLALAALAGAPGGAAAQALGRIYFGAPADTGIGLMPGTETQIAIRTAYVCSQVNAARLTIRYDSTKVKLVGVLPAMLPTGIDTTRPGPGRFTVRGAGYPCGSDQSLFTLRAVLGSSVTDGTYLWASVDSMSLVGYTPAEQSQPLRTSIAQFCHATQLFGDVDNNGRIDSRDALIALSAAVGLPVTGFNLAVGDVDRDGLTNSRDALLMLSWAIGLPMPSVNIRIGVGAPDACPGTSAPGETVVFKRQGAGIEVLGASSTAPVLVSGTTPADSAPRLAANGTLIVYQCADSVYPQYYSEICRINADGTGKLRLTPGYPTGYNYHTLPDVNPSAARIAFLSSSQLWTVADSAGATAAGFPVTVNSVNGVAWSRNGLHLAYTTGGFYAYVNAIYTYIPPGLYSVDSVGAAPAVRLDSAYTYGPYYGQVRWSPKGDSLAYVRTDGRVWALPAAGGTVAPLTNFFGTTSGFDWGPQGLLFSLDTGNRHPSLWLLPSQNAPIQRITGPVTGDWQPAFRRNP